MIPDPPVRRDGLCVTCGGPRTMPKTRQKGVDPGEYLRDPFCASLCCRAFHGNPLPYLGANAAEKRGRHVRVAA